jgi:multidrug efflux pump subunit AcrA (membrane-fusion protein)
METVALLDRLAPLLKKFWQYGAMGALALLCWHFQNRAVVNADTARAQAAFFKQAQKDAEAQWAKKLSDQKAQYAQFAKETQSDYETRLAQYAPLVRGYIATHHASAVLASVQPAPTQGGGGPAEGTTAPGGAPVLVGMPASVVVSASDLRSCAALYAYAVDAHNWAMKIGQPTP